MLTILGDKHPDFCDGVTRRSFLKIGGLAMGGLALPQLLQAERQPGSRRSHKAVIMIFLAGGPPHQDMWDLKTDAPSEFRGEFRPIKTNVPGIEICELFPRVARIMDKLAIIRSIVGAMNEHDAYQCLTGHHKVNGVQPKGGWPCLGSIVSKVEGPATLSVPPAVGLAPRHILRPWEANGSPGCLGVAHAPFTPQGDEMKADMILKRISLNRLRDRKSLLGSFDTFRREADASGAMDGMDVYNRQAMDILTSSRLADALDISKEDARTLERYPRIKGSDKLGGQEGGPGLWLDQFLLARRLVEAGARCVTLGFGQWDWHDKNFERARENFPMLDQGVTALVEDLYSRGLDKDVSVVVWGEFGRSPTINKGGGRDHHSAVSCALLAGGGMNTGRVIGATDRRGHYAADRPVRFEEVFATLYLNLGIDPHRTTITDLAGRPHYLLEPEDQPIRELV